MPAPKPQHLIQKLSNPDSVDPPFDSSPVVADFWESNSLLA